MMYPIKVNLIEHKNNKVTLYPQSFLDLFRKILQQIQQDKNHE